MSVNTTPFLHLPQWDANEQPSYLGEINPAFAAIDSGYGDIKTLAQTGVSGSQEAITTANDAKAQSQANAGAITTLQQEHAALEADFVNSHYSRQLNLECTVEAENVTVKNAVITYNDYFAHIRFELTFSQDTQFPRTTKILSVSNFPGTVQRLYGLTNMVQLPTTMFTVVAVFDGTNLSILGIGGNNHIAAQNYFVPFFVPIFTMPSTRDSLMDDCMYLPAR